MKFTGIATVLALAGFSAFPTIMLAQTTTGANTSITLPTPPRTMASMPVPTTPGVDATYQGNVQPNPQGTFTLTVPWTYSGSGSAAAAAVAAPMATQQTRPLPKPSRTDSAGQSQPF